ncbi:MAG: hypothetical protein ACLUIW_06990 [Dysosmobacter welbionis]
MNGKEIQAEGSSVTVGGVTIITGGSPDMEETGTLDLDGPGHQHDLLPGGGPGPL